MTSQEAITILVANSDALRARGVQHAALFGSVARGEARSDSDLDVLIDLAPDARLGVFEYVGIRQFIADLFNGPVDVVDRAALKPHVRPTAERDAINIF